MIGGARNSDFETEHSSEFLLNESIQNQLYEFLKDHVLPGNQFSVSHRWSGIMGFTEDKQPHVQQIDDNVLAVLACNGMGVALSPVIAEIISDKMLME